MAPRERCPIARMSCPSVCPGGREHSPSLVPLPDAPPHLSRGGGDISLTLTPPQLILAVGSIELHLHLGHRPDNIILRRGLHFRYIPSTP